MQVHCKCIETDLFSWAWLWGPRAHVLHGLLYICWSVLGWWSSQCDRSVYALCSRVPHFPGLCVCVLGVLVSLWVWDRIIVYLPWGLAAPGAQTHNCSWLVSSQELCCERIFSLAQKLIIESVCCHGLILLICLWFPVGLQKQRNGVGAPWTLNRRAEHGPLSWEGDNTRQSEDTLTLTWSMHRKYSAPCCHFCYK